MEFYRGITMNQLRMAIEKKKQTLIDALIHLEVIPPTDPTISTMTLSELVQLLNQSQKMKNRHK